MFFLETTMTDLTVNDMIAEIRTRHARVPRGIYLGWRNAKKGACVVKLDFEEDPIVLANINPMLGTQAGDALADFFAAAIFDIDFLLNLVQHVETDHTAEDRRCE
jgi:hypothetical protein